MFPFLDLPAEIRFFVYAALLEDQPLPLRKELPIALQDLQTPYSVAAILETCRHVHDEATPMFYRRVDFDTFDTICSGLLDKFRGPFFVRSIREISVQWQPGLFRWLHVQWPALKGFEQLQRLTLVFSLQTNRNYRSHISKIMDSLTDCWDGDYDSVAETDTPEKALSKLKFNIFFQFSIKDNTHKDVEDLTHATVDMYNFNLKDDILDKDDIEVMFTVASAIRIYKPPLPEGFDMHDYDMDELEQIVNRFLSPPDQADPELSAIQGSEELDSAASRYFEYATSEDSDGPNFDDPAAAISQHSTATAPDATTSAPPGNLLPRKPTLKSPASHKGMHLTSQKNLPLTNISDQADKFTSIPTNTAESHADTDVSERSDNHAS